MKKGYWSAFDEHSDGLEMTSGDSGLCVEVTEERAMDSYNTSVTCSANLSRETATALRDWLNDMLGEGA